MLRKLSASGFALTMIALIALRLPALGFCLCADDFIINDGVCCETTATQPASTECECCPEEIAPAESEPCRDCVVVLSLDPGEFNWAADQFSPAQEYGTPLALPAGYQDDLPLASSPAPSLAPIRGSPPIAGLPVYLRAQVLKL